MGWENEDGRKEMEEDGRKEMEENRMGKISLSKDQNASRQISAIYCSLICIRNDTYVFHILA
jgi:hypothetical protein